MCLILTEMCNTMTELYSYTKFRIQLSKLTRWHSPAKCPQLHVVYVIHLKLAIFLLKINIRKQNECPYNSKILKCDAKEQQFCKRSMCCLHWHLYDSLPCVRFKLVFYVIYVWPTFEYTRHFDRLKPSKCMSFTL